VQLALERNCRGIAWTYNEPTIWFEYTYDSAILAKEAGLYTVYVTNGYMTSQALEKIGPYLDAANVDVKGFSKRFYNGVCKRASIPCSKRVRACTSTVSPRTDVSRYSRTER